VKEPRCAACGRKLAERVDGPAEIKCSKCKAVNVIEVVEVRYSVRLK
jgi:LSD1 subclass zinc finger protein